MIHYRKTKTYHRELFLFPAVQKSIEAQSRNANQKRISCHVLGIHKKKQIVFEGIYAIDCLANCVCWFSKCDLVIIEAESSGKDAMLHMLGKFSFEKFCFAPIVSLENGDILFFPKLRYGDNRLLEYTLRSKLGEQKFVILYGRESEKVIA